MSDVLNRMRECILDSHEQNNQSETATLIFSCADALGPFVDPGISAAGQEAIGSLFVKQMNQFDEELIDESRERILLDLMNDCSRERIGAFFKKRMNGFHEEVASKNHDMILAELHDRYLAGFDGCFFPTHVDSSYVEPVTWLPDGTEVATAINLEQLMQDFLTTIDEVENHMQEEVAVLDRMREYLDSDSPPNCISEGE